MFNQKVFWLCLAFMMPYQMIASQTFDSNALVYELKENNFFSKTHFSRFGRFDGEFHNV